MQIPASSASRGAWNVDGPVVDPDLAGIGAIEAGEDVRESRLACAVLAEQRVHLARGRLEVDAVVGDDAREALDDSVQLDRGHEAHPPQWAGGSWLFENRLRPALTVRG